MVLSNTAAKIATPAIWQDRIDSIRRTGICPVSDTTMSHWLSPKMRASSTMSPWHNMMRTTRPEGYIDCAHANSVTDFITTISTLQLPFMGIAADHDRPTPPGLVRKTLNLIPGSTFHIIRGADHLPFVEQPREFAGLLTSFLESTSHI